MLSLLLKVFGRFPLVCFVFLITIVNVVGALLCSKKRHGHGHDSVIVIAATCLNGTVLIDEHLRELGYWFNTAYLVVEKASAGQTVCDRLYNDAQYPLVVSSSDERFVWCRGKFLRKLCFRTIGDFQSSPHNLLNGGSSVI